MRSCWRTVAVGLMIAGALAGCSGSRPVRLTVDRPDAPADQPVHLRLTGLAGGERVTMTATTTDARHERWSASVRYAADGAGVLDLTRAVPVDGEPYDGVDGMGLFAAMQPAGDPAARYDPADRETVTVTASAGGHRLASRTLVRRAAVAGLRTTRLTPARDGVSGTLFAPAGSARRPAVLLLGGSEGGEGLDPLARLLAMHGYPALSVAYFAAPQLPAHLVDIPVEYAGKALRYLAKRPDVDPARITALGISYGTGLAELAGVHYPALVHGVVVGVPTNVSLFGLHRNAPLRDEPAWTWRGRPVPFTRQFSEPAPTDVPAAVIPVDRIDGPLLATCGGQDATWSSCPQGRALIARLAAHHDRHAHRLLSYPRAGHRSGGLLPYQPLGSDPQVGADDRARAAEWPALLHFLATLPG